MRACARKRERERDREKTAVTLESKHYGIHSNLNVCENTGKSSKYCARLLVSQQPFDSTSARRQ